MPETNLAELLNPQVNKKHHIEAKLWFGTGAVKDRKKVYYWLLKCLHKYV
jgi:hypothetical protein